MKKQWKEVPGYEGSYWVNTNGAIKSKRKILTPILDSGGYAQVTLYKDGSGKICLVHRIVAKAFIENKQSKYAVNHIDNNRSNNEASNLEWVTRTENMQHAAVQNRMPGRKGENTHLAKLSELDVKEIRKLDGVVRPKDLAAKFNITYRNLRSILTKKTWQNI